MNSELDGSSEPLHMAILQLPAECLTPCTGPENLGVTLTGQCKLLGWSEKVTGWQGLG